MKMNKKMRETIAGYGFCGIWIIGFALLTLYPLIRTFIFSFQKVELDPQESIITNNIQFENFKTLLTTDLVFITAIKDFVFQVLVYVPIIIIFAFIVAIMLNQKIKFRGIFRAIYFLPVIIISGPVVNELFNQGIASLSILEEYGVYELINQMFPEWLATHINSMFEEIIFILW